MEETQYFKNKLVLDGLITSKLIKETHCIEMQENCVCPILSNSYILHWQTFQIIHENVKLSDIDSIKSLINKYHFVRLDMYLYSLFDCNDYCHSCCILKESDSSLSIYDSYIETRELESRRFDINDLKNLLLFPTINNWNSLLKCHEDVNNQLEENYKLQIDYSYVDPMVDQHWYIDGQLIES